MKHIFLSYSRLDTAIMQQMREHLQSKDFKVWTDEGIEPGTTLWKDAIEAAIEAAGCMIVILSPDAKKSQWVKKEIDYASSQKVQVFPVLARGDEQQSIPFALIGSQYIDIRIDQTQGMVLLRKGIHSHLIRALEAQLTRQSELFLECVNRELDFAIQRGIQANQYGETLNSYHRDVTLRTLEEIQEEEVLFSTHQGKARQIKTELEQLVVICAEKQVTWSSQSSEWMVTFEVVRDKQVTSILQEHDNRIRNGLQSLQNALQGENTAYEKLLEVTNDFLEKAEHTLLVLRMLIHNNTETTVSIETHSSNLSLPKGVADAKVIASLPQSDRIRFPVEKIEVKRVDVERRVIKKRKPL